MTAAATPGPPAARRDDQPAGAAASTPPAARSGPGGGPPAGVRAARRELGVVLVVALAGAALALLAAGRTWLRVTAARRPPLPDVTVALSGKAVEPLVAALGVVGLAALVALLATRGRGRQAVGALLAGCGLLLAVRAIGRIAGPDRATALSLLTDAGKASGLPAGATISTATSPVWPVLVTFAGLAMFAAGAAVLLRSRRWPGMSARYDAPATAPGHPAAAPAGQPDAGHPDAGQPDAGQFDAGRSSAGLPPEAVWAALDRGDDPTVTA